MKENVSIDLW